MKSSYSALKTFTQCPFRYKVLYIEKKSFPPNLSALFGIILHSIFEKYVRNEIDSCDKLVDLFHILWDTRTHTYPESARATYAKEGEKILRDFFASNRDTSNIVSVEQKILFDIRDSERNETHHITSILDRVDRGSSSDELIVIDYKTGQTTLTKPELKSDLQFQIYGRALQKSTPLFPPRKIYGTLYNVRKNTKVTVELSLEKLREVDDHLLQIIRRIQSTQTFIPRKGMYCDHCPLITRCPLHV